MEFKDNHVQKIKQSTKVDVETEWNLKLLMHQMLEFCIIVDVETERNLKLLFTLLITAVVSVDVETEWNLKLVNVYFFISSSLLV